MIRAAHPMGGAVGIAQVESVAEFFRGQARRVLELMIASDIIDAGLLSGCGGWRGCRGRLA